jgi:2-polyprenyl-6-hydroxyphenyl methylase/3-demethylubiquinone-9 3-methyltransferase
MMAQADDHRQAAPETPFAFGANWRRFLELIDDARIATAEASLGHMLERDRLQGLSFLDAGSGSGLFSLAARRLGARVHSFDLDPDSLACTRELQRRYFADDPLWTCDHGSVLDRNYLGSLGVFDVVYSWGVVHHTGAMWRALDNLTERVAPNGLMFIAIYNDQGRTSRRWAKIKRHYNRLPPALRWLVLGPAFLRLWGPTLARDWLRGAGLAGWRAYAGERGMSPWRDVVDWVGGWPFEVAKPEAVFDFFRQRGFHLQKLKTCAGGLGCNEFVFQREAVSADARAPAPDS